MAQAILDPKKKIEVAKAAAQSLEQLIGECEAVGLNFVAHFVGVAALEAEDAAQELEAAQATSNVIEKEVQAWAEKEMPDRDLKSANK